MHPAIQIRREHKRGCGWRQENGLYLVSDSPVGSCNKLPISLDVLNCCPHCHEHLPADDQDLDGELI